MVQVIIINKSGDLRNKNVRNLNLNNIYKKCNFLNNTNFDKRHTWKYKKEYFSVFATNKGKANTENKYDFPPPIDCDLYFGNIIIIKSSDSILTNDNMINTSVSEWDKVYEKIFGGFENINSNSENDYESDELLHYPKEQLTKQGYLKDGFVISNDEIDADADDEIDDDADVDDELDELDDDDADDADDEIDDDDDADVDDDADDEIDDNDEIDNKKNKICDNSDISSVSSFSSDTEYVNYTDSELTSEEYTDEEN